MRREGVVHERRRRKSRPTVENSVTNSGGRRKSFLGQRVERGVDGDAVIRHHLSNTVDSTADERPLLVPSSDSNKAYLPATRSRY